jgi:hypothetical protein
MTTRTIKDVDDETWSTLKGMAKAKGLKMGDLLKEITATYKRTPSDSWRKILDAKPVLTGNEAASMLRTVEKLRKESGYRNVIAG